MFLTGEVLARFRVTSEVIVMTGSMMKRRASSNREQRLKQVGLTKRCGSLLNCLVSVVGLFRLASVWILVVLGERFRVARLLIVLVIDAWSLVVILLCRDRVILEIVVLIHSLANAVTRTVLSLT